MRLPILPLISSALMLSAGGFPQALAQTQPSATISVYSREVVVDVNVTDAKGNPVHGLTRDNFTVLENNQPVTPRSFLEHRSDQPGDTPAPAKPSLPPNSFTNAAPPEAIRPLEVLLVDSLDTPVATQGMVHNAVVDFAGKIAPGTRVAVFSLSATGQLAIVQGFTSDPEVLKKTLKSRKLELQIPSLEDAGQDPNSGEAPNTNLVDDANTKTPLRPQPPKPQTPQVDQNIECNHAAVRGQYTIAALAQIGRYLSGMPGRKNLIWFTGIFPLRENDRQGGVCYDLREPLGAAQGLLEHSHVAVFPIDSRGLDIIAKDGPESRIGRLATREHLTMESVAEGTGGKAFYNTNDLTTAAMQAMDAGSNYYTITYNPPNPNNDTRARNISVKVDQPDLTLVYKRNYHALPPGIALNGKPIETVTPLQSAMMRGALEPTQILFHIDVAPAAATETTPAPGNNPDPKAMKPPYRRLTLAYTIDLNGIQFDPAADGSYHGQFEYEVNVYSAGDGKLLNSNAMASKPALPPAVYQSMLANGAKLHQDIDIPAKGDYILRIGVHDVTSDRVGAIEIPTSSITP